MNLGDQRTGGVDNRQPAFLTLPAHFGGHAVRAENRPRAVRHLVQFLDENRAQFAQFLHDVLVVNDFLAHINRRPVQIQRDFHDVDGPHHAGAESTGLEEIDLLVSALIQG